jgi:ribonuclease D
MPSTSASPLSSDFQIVATVPQLEQACRILSKQSVITVDTEFQRRNTYYPILSLLQVACADQCFVIDVILGRFDRRQLAPLFDVLHNRAILKVMHACQQDMEIFLTWSGAVPAPIFDTQVAAMVCEYGSSISYQSLTERVLPGVKIDKTHQRSTWLKRPLNAGQYHYAASDVTHLLHVYSHLERELAANGRRSWLVDSFAEMEDCSTYLPEPYLQFKTTRGNHPVYLSLVRELARWREQLARARDIVRRHLLEDDTLCDIAREVFRVITLYQVQCLLHPIDDTLIPLHSLEQQHWWGEWDDGIAQLPVKQWMLSGVAQCITTALTLPANERPTGTLRPQTKLRTLTLRMRAIQEAKEAAAAAAAAAAATESEQLDPTDQAIVIDPFASLTVDSNAMVVEQEEPDVVAARSKKRRRPKQKATIALPNTLNNDQPIASLPQKRKAPASDSSNPTPYDRGDHKQPHKRGRGGKHHTARTHSTPTTSTSTASHSTRQPANARRGRGSAQRQ